MALLGDTHDWAPGPSLRPRRSRPGWAKALGVHGVPRGTAGAQRDREAQECIDGVLALVCSFGNLWLGGLEHLKSSSWTRFTSRWEAAGCPGAFAKIS